MRGDAKLENCPTTEMIADMVTKPLNLQKLARHRKLMPLMSLQTYTDE